MQRVLIIGANGMLGHKLVQRLSGQFGVSATLQRGFDTVERFGIISRERVIEHVDAVHEADLIRAIKIAQPEIVINAAGVIKQRPSSSDVVTTLMVNSVLPHRLYRLSQMFGYRLILISTDCVFAGDRGNYSEDDTADALDLYGQSKHHGEVIGDGCLTIRTSIIGRELETSNGLIEWFLNNRGGKVKGFKRAIYTGFPTVVIADIIVDLLQNHPELKGLYHISSEPIDKFTLLTLVNDEFGANVEIEADESVVIDRSLDSTRFRSAIGFKPTSWTEMIEQLASDRTPYDKWRK
jgi:dTDP-4-dehydrorhamnose reductase